MALLFRLLVVAALVWLALRLFRRPRPRYKCATCRHCGELFPDGVLCRDGSRETFKNPIHIEMCPDFEDDPRIPR